MKIRITIFLFLSVSFHYGNSQTLRDYLRAADENNPEIRAAYSSFEATRARIQQVSALPDPEITASMFISRDGFYMERWMGRQNAEVQLMQMFPSFGMLRTRKEEASRMAVAEYESIRETRSRVRQQVKLIYYDLYRIEQQIRITRSNLDILKTYERLALSRFQHPTSATSPTPSRQMNQSAPASTSSGNRDGMSSMQGSSISSTMSGTQNMGAEPMGSSRSRMSDVLRAKMQINDLENELLILEESRRPLYAQFNQLLNRAYETPVSITDSLAEAQVSIDRQAILDSIKSNNPMIRMLEAESKVYESQQRMGQLEGRPMFGVGLTYMQFSPRYMDSMPMGGDDMVMPMVRVTLPLYRKRYQGMVKEAEQNQKASSLKKDNAANQLTADWSNSLRDLDNATRKAKLYRDQRALARQTLDLVAKTYAAEDGQFEELLQIRQQLLDYDMKYIDAVVEQHRAIAMIEMLTSSELN